MQMFYFIVSIIAIVILILLLTIIGLVMRSSKKTVVFPSSQSQCPDMWIPDGNQCIFNGKNKGSFTTDTSKPYLFTTIDDYVKNGSIIKNDYNDYSVIDLSSSVWTTGGGTKLCGQNKWANKHNIQWSGIKEYNNC